MNKAFKIVWSKARKALMVANEATASIQARGVMTVAAVAVLGAMAGQAQAASSAAIALTPEFQEVTTPIQGGTEDKFKGTNSYLTATGSTGLAFVNAGYGSQANVQGVFAKYIQVQAADGSKKPINQMVISGGSISGLVADDGNKTATVITSSIGSDEVSAVDGLQLQVIGTTFQNNSAKNASGVAHLVKSDSTFTNTTLTGNQGLRGGAISWDGGSGHLVDSYITNNTATSGGGALSIVNGAKVTIEAQDRDWVITGNVSKATSGANKDSGFLYLNGSGGSQVTFDVGAGRQITIGQVGAATDGLASEAKVGDGSALNKTGAGKLLINSSLEGWNSDVNVQAGVLEVMGSIGSATYLTKTSNPQTLTVASGAQAILHNLTVNRGYENWSDPNCQLAEGFSVAVKAGGAFSADTVEVVSQAPAGTEGQALAGYMSVDTEKGGQSTIGQLNIQGGTFETWGSGTTVIQNVNLQKGQLSAKWNSNLRILGAVRYSTKDGGTVTVDSGATLATGWQNLFTATDFKTLTDFGSALKNQDGHILETEYSGTYTLENLYAINKLFNSSAEASSTKYFTFENATLEKADGNHYDMSEVVGVGGNLGQSTVGAGASSNNAVTVSGVDKNLSIGALWVDGSTKSVSISGNGVLTFNGSRYGGKIFEGQGNVESLTSEGKITLGTSSTDVIDVNAQDLNVKTLSVVGDVTAQKVTVPKDGTATISGDLKAQSIANAGTVSVGPTGALIVTGAPKTQGVASADLSGTIQVSGTLATSAVGANFVSQHEGAQGALYVDRTLSLASGTTLTIGATGPQRVTRALTGDSAIPTVTIEKGAVAYIDAATFMNKTATTQTQGVSSAIDHSVFGASTTVTNNGTVVLTHVTQTGTVTLGSASSTVGTVQAQSKFLEVSSQQGDLTVKTRTLAGSDALSAQLAGLYARGLTAKESDILDRIGSQDAFFTTVDSSQQSTPRATQLALTQAGQAAVSQATGGNVTAGVFNTAYDTNQQVADALTRHQLGPVSQTTGLWADMLYAQTQAKTLYGTSGYQSHITAGVLGVEGRVSDNATVGAALTLGQADTKSVGGVYDTKLDSNFYGLSAYLTKVLQGVHVKTDLTYLNFQNDFTGLGDASDAWSLATGMRVDYVAFDNGTVNATPHMGVRYTYVRTQAVAFNEAQALNSFEMPVGVTVAATFGTPEWKVAPSFDFTVVPQLANKTIHTFGASNVTVLNSGLYNATVGLEAISDRMTYGLQASYGFGASERANAYVSLRAAYRF